MTRETELVSPDQVWAAVAALEQQHSLGRINRADTDRRIAECRRAVTPRDLHKASGGLVGVRRRQDWWDVRRTVGALLFLLVLMAVGVWIVTWAMGLAEGNVPGITE